jgi:hypothetical protein
MSSTNWSGWSKVSRIGLDADTILGDPVVIRNKDGNREIFCIGTEEVLWRLSEKGIWARLGRPFEGFAFNPRNRVGIGKNLDGRLEVFALGNFPGQLWHIWQRTPGGAWSQWGLLDLGAPQGGFSHRSDQPDSTLAVGQNQDGRLEVFTLGAGDGNVWQIWQTAPNNGWSKWKSAGQPDNVEIEHITVGRNLDGRQEVFVKGGIAHIWQTAPNNGWSHWKNEGFPEGVVSAGPLRFQVGRNQDGRLQIFLLDQEHLWSIWQTAPNNGWSQWNTIVDRPSRDVFLGENLAVVQNIDGRLEIFAVETLSTMWHVWQTTPNGGWSAWHNLGKPAGVDWFGSPHFFDVDRHQDGKLEVFAKAGDNIWCAREL